ncbi:MAG: hypothetical protein H6812_08615 [Phycisphaeraceae bacterium]|nr:hypothetical protein [Phycisphaerales bacterium]MCB9843305.1 hypothetical protein [Phycisphaeraceae bacterium]
MTKHPFDADLCAIGRVKGNVGRDPGGLAYRVVSGCSGGEMAGAHPFIVLG